MQILTMSQFALFLYRIQKKISTTYLEVDQLIYIFYFQFKCMFCLPFLLACLIKAFFKLCGLTLYSNYNQLNITALVVNN